MNFKPLDPLLHSELRLAVMSATAGNLSVQIDKLSTAGYIQVDKTFKGKKPCTLCRITEVGRAAFENYVKALRTYLKIK